MDLRKMQAFVTLSEVKNYTKAAEALYTAQSSLSAQIKSLEKELDVPLLVRRPRDLELTEEGRLFLRFCNQTLGGYELLLSELRNPSKRRNFTIGLFYCSRLDSWCERISQINAAQSDVSYNIRIQYGAEKIESLLRHEIPIGFCLRSEALDQHGFQFRHVFFDCMNFDVPYSNPLSAKDSLTLEDVRGQKFLVISPKRTKAGGELIDVLIRRYGFSGQDFSFKENLDEIHLAMKAEGHIALIPGELHPGSSKRLPIPDGIAPQLDYGWYYDRVTPEVEWVLENLF